MARLRRLYLPGCAQHVIKRGKRHIKRCLVQLCQSGISPPYAMQLKKPEAR